MWIIHINQFSMRKCVIWVCTCTCSSENTKSIYLYTLPMNCKLKIQQLI